MRNVPGIVSSSLLALALFPTAEVSPQSPEAGAASSWIDFETIDQSALPILRARLNGTSAQRLVLDVSFRDFVLDTLIVDGSGLELPRQGELAEIDYYGKKERVPVAVLAELKLSELTFKNVRTLLIEGEDGTGFGGLRSYGRIGRDLLEPLRLTLHYPRRLLLLEPSPENEVPAGGVRYRGAGRFLLVPVTLSWDGGGEEVPFVLDSGTSHTVLDRKWAVRKGIAGKDSSSTRLPAVRVGAFEARDLSVLLGEMKELPYSAHSTHSAEANDEGQPVGVIGADLLLGLSVTYDFARDLIWLVSIPEEIS